jgi:aminoglycoside/choline kinase family phosphotransferase
MITKQKNYPVTPNVDNNMELRNVRKDLLAKNEIKYEGKTYSVPELNMQVKIRKNSTLKKWIIKYCLNHPIAKKKLHEAYNITKKDVEKSGFNTQLIEKRAVKRTK